MFSLRLEMRTIPIRKISCSWFLRTAVAGSKAERTLRTPQNPEYDRMFERMQVMERNGPERQALDRPDGRLVAPRFAMGLPCCIRRDYTLAHTWVYNRKPKTRWQQWPQYQRIDPRLRETMRRSVESPRGISNRGAVRSWFLVACTPAGAVVVPGAANAPAQSCRRRE